MTFRQLSALIGVLGFGWALVTAADARNEDSTQIVYETVVREIHVSPTFEDVMLTPAIDSLISDEEWAELDRQSDCLYEFLREHVGYEITLDAVVAAGYWTDVLGGACLVIGEDDVQEEG